SGLISAVGATGAPDLTFQVWPSSNCAVKGTVTVTGNWWVDCPKGFSIGNGVFDGPVSLSGVSTLTFNDRGNAPSSVPAACQPPLMTSWTGCLDSSSAKQAFVFMRSGDLSANGGQLIVDHA